MEMWRFYVELFVLMLAAFAVGSALAMLVVRLRVREHAPDRADAAGPGVGGTPGGAA